MAQSNRPIIGLLMSLFFTEALSAVGFRLPNQDPKAIARGNAFTATADNPSAIYYNPAGITQLEGQQLSIGVYAISAGFDFESDRGIAGSDTSFQFAPQLYYTVSPSDSKWSYGVGIFAPYGLAVDYGRNTPFSTLAIDGELVFGTVNPTIAYQLSPGLSLGLGLALNYSEISLSRSVGLAPGDAFSYEGDGTSLGWNAGALWQVNDQWSLGLNFRSATEVDYTGSSSFTGAPDFRTTTSLNFPMNITLGASYRPTERWNIGMGIDWTDWDSLDVAVLRGTAVGDVDFPFNYDSSFMYQIGITRYLDSGYFVSAGYLYSENSAPDLNFSPLNPDSNLHLWSLGFGRESAHHTWTFSYTLAYNGGRQVSGNVAQSLLGETADGRYKTVNHALNMAWRFSF